MKFIVITKTDKRDVAVGTASGMLAMLPVFVPGEILICNDEGRELTGRGRRPDKWYVEYQEFDELEAAIEAAREGH